MATQSAEEPLPGAAVPLPELDDPEENHTYWVVLNGRNAGIYDSYDAVDATAEPFRKFDTYEKAVAYKICGLHATGRDSIIYPVNHTWSSASFGHVKRKEIILANVAYFKDEQWGFKFAVDRDRQLSKPDADAYCKTARYVGDMNMQGLCVLSRSLMDQLHLCLGDNELGALYNPKLVRLIIAVNSEVFIKKMRKGRNFPVSDMQELYKRVVTLPVQLVFSPLSLYICRPPQPKQPEEPTQALIAAPMTGNAESPVDCVEKEE